MMPMLRMSERAVVRAMAEFRESFSGYGRARGCGRRFRGRAFYPNSLYKKEKLADLSTCFTGPGRCRSRGSLPAGLSAGAGTSIQCLEGPLCRPRCGKGTRLRHGPRGAPGCIAADAVVRRVGPLSPEGPAGERRPVGECLQLRPGDLRVTAQPQPAVGRGNDSLASYDVGKATDARGDQLRVLDQRRRVTDDSGGQQLVVRQLHLLPQDVLVLVTHVGG